MCKWNIGWGVEVRCDMNCAFCYSKEVRVANNLNIDVYTKFIERNHKNISSINYGTGENSLSEDWFKLVEYIGNNYPFIRQALTTNGHISKACKDSRKLDLFVKYIDEVDVSLDFADRNRHNEFRGNSEAYDMAISTLQLCKYYNKQATLVFLGTNEVTNTNNLEGLFQIAYTYNSYLRSNIYRPTQGINNNTKRFILGYSNLINMLIWISKNHKIIKISDRLLAAVLGLENVEDFTGYSSLRILGDGSITPSTYLISKEYRKYNIINEISLSEIDFSNQILRDFIPSECLECTMQSFCKGGVYDRRLLWYGTLKERDPYCPYRYQKIDLKDIVLSPSDFFESVHDGYLPTLFFAC